jgi:hypothetical protein
MEIAKIRTVNPADTRQIGDIRGEKRELLFLPQIFAFAANLS